LAGVDRGGPSRVRATRIARAGSNGSPSLVDSAEQALHNWLAGGRYRQGDRLPPEHEVAAMLGVSRGTLRSALQRLEESGEIVRRQGSGTFVGRQALPSALDERLERLEPYSSLAARRGLTLSCIELKIEQRAVGSEVGEALGLAPIAQATMFSRTLVADNAPVAVMFDVVHPSVSLPPEEVLRRSLEDGQMVLDTLLAVGVPITYARTRVLPCLLDPRERAGKLLGVRRVTAVLQLEELVYAGRDERVAYSRDLFAPGGLDVTVMRSLESTRPAPVVSFRGADGSRRRRGRTAG
jgi:DNA-binding GntR family transcriptional regulator